jgi:hypothetical protein
MNVIEVGKKYSGPIPPQDGLHFEIGPDGDMQMLIQFQKPAKSEKKALAAGFERYSLYRHAGDIILACWVFKFPAPVSYMDAPFHAGLYPDERIRKFLSTDQNLLQVVILDGSIVQGLRAIGLHWEAMQMFRDIVREQLTSISRSEYDAAIDALYALHSKEIYQRGKIFTHREEN